MKEKSLIYAFISIILLSTIAAIAKLTLRNINSIQLLFFVTLFSILGIFFFLVFTNRVNSLGKYNLRDNLRMVLLGFFGMFLTPFLFYAALERIGAIETNIIHYTWPIWILILSLFFLKEKFSLKILLAILISFIGVIIIITGGSLRFLIFDSLYGILFALLSALTWGIFAVFSKKLKFEPSSAMFYYSLYAFIFALVLAFFTKNLIFPDFSSILGSAYIGIFPTALAFAFWLKAIKLEKASFIANLTYLTPFLSLIFIYLLIGEVIIFSHIFGLILIILGILIHTRYKN